MTSEAPAPERARGYWGQRGWWLALEVGLFLMMNAATVWSFSIALERGDFPVDADSISIPIFGGLILWTLVLMISIAAILMPASQRWWRYVRAEPCVLIGAGMIFLGVLDLAHEPADPLTIGLLVYGAAQCWVGVRLARRPGRQREISELAIP
jgi:hypothetical protein